MNLLGHSTGRICVVPEANGRVWQEGGTEEQCVPAPEGGKQGQKATWKREDISHGREKIPFCPALSQSNVYFAMFAIFLEESCLSFLVCHITDTYITYMPYILLHFTHYIFLFF